MAKFKILMKYSDGTCEEQNGVFNSAEAAEEYACYLVCCSQGGGEILEEVFSGDYLYEDYDDMEYEIVEFDDKLAVS